MVCAKYDAMITIMANSCMSPGQIAEKAGADFCRKLYGYCLTDDAFLEKVMEKLKALDRDKVVYIYSAFASTYIHFQMQEEKKAALWLAERIDRNYERKVKQEAWKRSGNRQTDASWMNGMF